MMKPKANTANTAKMAKRLLSYIISRYKATFAAVLFCISSVRVQLWQALCS